MKGASRTRLQFLGATDTVTGSRYLVESQERRVLVDCGLFQGYKRLRERNWLRFPVVPQSIDAVLLTHAHLDHTGYLPSLIRDGFSGPVYATSGTAELCTVLLPDSGYLQEEEARYAEYRGSSRHSPAKPLYTREDAFASLKHFRAHEFDHPIDLGGGMEATFLPAGHILGAAQIHLDVGGHSVHFTGDLGRSNDPLMQPPRGLEPAHVLVTESTYGNRAHPAGDPGTILADIVNRVAKKNGVVLIAAFAVGRAETLLLHLSRLRAEGRIAKIPVYLNSPMAIDATDMYRHHRKEHRLEQNEYEAMYKLPIMTRTADDSRLLDLRGGPMIIISASGMLTGGRILHHLESYGPDPRNAIVLSGYQAGGTRGAALAGGAKELRIYGQDVPIRAEVVQIEGFSAHADSDDIMKWLHAAPKAPRMTYITHGEPEASDALRLRINHELGWPARVPEYLESVNPANPR
ncbi:MBL fold metallo-hydrolase RNA specificity domain-containing protein [Arthrobacter sp. SLBN-100]|uniref:MBL fold metallo-hydrolase RNA specificity domain-containing protein n=1 Tax=Arthrobacter sp. SLBN-100 TaxID=2768450 RepID=UPI00114E231A|nr:MBL fold metallo-hydrolase [Arthrobacter sp. SLBN-100]